jgi:hypothetical protein
MFPRLKMDIAVSPYLSGLMQVIQFACVFVPFLACLVTISEVSDATFLAAKALMPELQKKELVTPAAANLENLFRVDQIEHVPERPNFPHLRSGQLGMIRRDRFLIFLSQLSSPRILPQL